MSSALHHSIRVFLVLACCLPAAAHRGDGLEHGSAASPIEASPRPLPDEGTGRGIALVPPSSHDSAEEPGEWILGFELSEKGRPAAAMTAPEHPLSPSITLGTGAVLKVDIPGARLGERILRSIPLGLERRSGPVVSSYPFGQPLWEVPSIGGEYLHVRNSWPGVDELFALTPDGVKHDLLVDEGLISSLVRPDGTADLVARWLVQVPPGTLLNLEEGAGAVLRDRDGTFLVRIPEPTLFDGHGHAIPTGPAVAYLELRGTAPSYELAVVTSGAWLNRPGITAPVRIDPTITMRQPDATEKTGMVDELGLRNEGSMACGSLLLVGRGEDVRAFAEFDTSPIPDSATIQEVRLQVWLANHDNPGDDAVPLLHEIKPVPTTVDVDNATLFAAIPALGSGTTYVSENIPRTGALWCPEAYEFRDYDLGAQAVADLQAQLPDDFFTLGFVAEIVTDEDFDHVDHIGFPEVVNNPATCEEIDFPGTRITLVVQFNQAPECDAGGPYVGGACPTDPIALSATASDPDGDDVTVSWSTDCPGTISPLDALDATLLLDTECGETCSVSLTVTDGELTTTCEATVDAMDTTPPLVEALLSPAAPLPPTSAGDCTTVSSRAFLVQCGATDECDPAPTASAELVVTSTQVEQDGTCSLLVENVPVECDQLVELRLLAPPCPADGPTSAGMTVLEGPGGTIVAGESIVLVVTGTDRCGNGAQASDDPTADPPDGSCPDLAPEPAPDCPEECDFGCTDADSDGAETDPCGNDCDDTDGANFPGNDEDCSDAQDNDCDGDIDCADADCSVDDDGDGALAAPCGDDCDDSDSANFPGNDEDCADGVDNDCDAEIDCADSDCAVDADSDGELAEPCGGDCDDEDPEVLPGNDESGFSGNCGDGVDNDCDGAADCDDFDCFVDLDGDTIAGTPCGEDCDDGDENVPAETETACSDGVDNDCDGFIDDDDIDCVDELCNNLADDDGDGLFDCNDDDCCGSDDCPLSIPVEQLCSGGNCCENGNDDDCDGEIDCDDPNCASDPACEGVEDCDNGLDEDSDGLIDCDDPDCQVGGVEDCDDGVDDDCDGDVDCDDTDCIGTVECSFETCTNGADDDSDGLTDCDDDDCCSSPDCTPPTEETVCDDDNDGDCDGDIDCVDDDCSDDSDCIAEGSCTDGSDGDGDGLIDCDDDECCGTIFCIAGTPSSELDCSNGSCCTNGNDDDCDGSVDCDDANCSNDAACAAEICNDGLDNDSDGFADCGDPDCDGVPGPCTGGEVCCAATGACELLADCPEDTDGDGLSDAVELFLFTDIADADTDDDGLSDGEEVLLTGTTPTAADSDADGVQDGTELGDTTPVPDPDGGGPLEGTDLSVFVPDADPGTTTEPFVPDTDGGGVIDGVEDANGNGAVDVGETDPNDPADD